jgi:chemotaxis protein CheX
MQQPRSSRMDSWSTKAEFINQFLESTVSVLTTMASVKPIAGTPYLKKGASVVGDVSAIVGITGEAEGSLCLTFTQDSILFIVRQMFGEEKTEVDEEVKDAVGELTNMISGASRRSLEDLGYHFQGAIPCIISGHNHEVRHVTKGPILSIPFNTDAGGFTVEVCFK